MRVRLAHLVDGRARLRLLDPMDPASAETLADALAGVPGVTRVRARPNTGSVIVDAALARDALATLLDGCGLLTILPRGKPVNVGIVAQYGLARLDRRIRQASDDALDLRSTLAVALLAAAAVQLARGRVAGPATTLVLGALALIERRPQA